MWLTLQDTQLRTHYSNRDNHTVVNFRTRVKDECAGEGSRSFGTGEKANIFSCSIKVVLSEYFIYIVLVMMLTSVFGANRAFTGI